MRNLLTTQFFNYYYDGFNRGLNRRIKSIRIAGPQVQVIWSRVQFAFSFIRTLTVGPGITPGLLTLQMQALAGLPFSGNTAGGEFRPALRTWCHDYVVQVYVNN